MQLQIPYYYDDAFGNVLSKTGTVNNSIRYAGYKYDEETGLYYLNARMYDPVTARFLQEDTYRGNKNDPLSLNLYAYCSNNPIRYTDPTWHESIFSWLYYKFKGTYGDPTIDVKNSKGKSKSSSSTKKPSTTKPSTTRAKTDGSNFWESRKGTWIFPVKGETLDATTSERRFGAQRTKGRIHAGVDLYAKNGTEVVAMTDGKVIGYSDDFYADTNAVEVRNSDGTIARYCEISSSVKVGDSVKQGDKIGTIIPNTETHGTMLHLEVYDGTGSGALTQRSNSSNYKYVPVNKYERRSDLVDPMGVLDLKGSSKNPN